MGELYSSQEIFDRSRLILGDEAMAALANRRVIIFGIGGVGSWTAEALVRTGLRHLTIVDADRVAPSNINRQAPATTLTVGEPKTEAMRRKLLEINPEARITAINRLYSAETASEFNLADYDCIIDAIDSLADKAELILHATSLPKEICFLSSMGAALKLDPTQIKVAEFWKVEGCPLGAALRRRFRKSHRFPGRKFNCVYSPERAGNLGSVAASSENTLQPMTFGKVAVNGSLCHITAIFGMTLAGLALRHLTQPDLA